MHHWLHANRTAGGHRYHKLILAAMLLPALNSAKKKAGQTYCMNNLKQLGLGMSLYTDENSDTYPSDASLSGFTTADWIFWQTTKWSRNPISQSPVAQYLGGLNSNLTNSVAGLFRCPMDTYDTERSLERLESPSTGAYLFSYSMQNSGGGLVNGKNLGLSSILDSTGT